MDDTRRTNIDRQCRGAPIRPGEWPECCWSRNQITRVISGVNYLLRSAVATSLTQSANRIPVRPVHQTGLAR